MSDIKVMRVSAINNLPSRLTFLAKMLQSEHQANTEPLYIESYRIHDENVIRLSTKNGIYTEINPYDKEEGEILPFSVSVNLYDFFNTVDQCVDELISLWIDEETNELVLNSFYSPTKELDELEVRFNIIDKKFPFRTFDIDPNAKLLSSIPIQQMELVTILTQLNYENSADGVNIIVENKKLKFQSVYGGLKTELILKQYELDIFENDCSIFIPFNVFNLMISTGQYTDIIFNIYDNNTVIVDTNDYKFVYVDTINQEVFALDASKYSDYFVIDAKVLESNMKLVSKLTQQIKNPTIHFEKVDNVLADIITVSPSKLSIAVRTDLAMLSDKEMNIDSQIFCEMIRNTGIDGIRVRVDDYDGVYIAFDNRMIRKQMSYDHSDFCKFRTYSE